MPLTYPNYTPIARPRQGFSRRLGIADSSPSGTRLPRRPHHRQNAGPDRLGQRRPCIHDFGEIRAGRTIVGGATGGQAVVRLCPSHCRCYACVNPPSVYGTEGYWFESNRVYSAENITHGHGRHAVVATAAHHVESPARVEPVSIFGRYDKLIENRNIAENERVELNRLCPPIKRTRRRSSRRARFPCTGLSTSLTAALRFTPIRTPRVISLVSGSPQVTRSASSSKVSRSVGSRWRICSYERHGSVLSSRPRL